MVAQFLLLVVLFCTVNCNPLGQTTVCESTSNLLPNFVPNYGSTTVCESSNVFPYPHLYPGMGATTVCESGPNALLAPLGYPGIGYTAPGFGLAMGSYGLGGLGLGGVGYLGSVVHPGATTVCESTQNLGFPVGMPYGVGGATVCESVPNAIGYTGYPYGYGFGGLPATICDTVPNVYGLGYPFGPLGLPGLGATTICETGPNVFPGLAYPYTRPFL